MKNKKGFTLVELMAVIIIISLIAILTFPNIINQIKKSKQATTNNINDIVISAAKRYVADNPDKYDNQNYCMNISELVDNDYVKEDIINTAGNMKEDKVVKITYDGVLKYEIVDQKKCCSDDYCDNDGNGYTKLAYIESTGEQYIDTEYVFKNKPKVTGAIKITSSSDRDIMGNSTEKTGCFIIDFASNNLYYRYSSASYTLINTGISLNKWYNFEFSDKVIVNGIEKGSISTYNFSNNDQSFLIGKGRNYGYARFKEIKMYDGDELVRDLVPVYRESDNKPGMFDTINKKFYTSKTNNDFVPSQNKDMELQYIESTGTQYIDTEYVFKNKPKVTGDIMITSSSDRDIMGNSTSKAGCFIIDFASNNLYYRYSSASYTLINTGISLNKWYNFEFSDKVIVDGVEKGSVNSYDFASNDQKFLIGRGRKYGYGYARFKEIKMYDGDELVRDLVPYYKKDIGDVGMLDKVHNVFYENQGTGEFLWG